MKNENKFSQFAHKSFSLNDVCFHTANFLYVSLRIAIYNIHIFKYKVGTHKFLLQNILYFPYVIIAHQLYKESSDFTELMQM